MLFIFLLTFLFLVSFSPVSANSFSGQLYEDPDANTIGFGGTDNRCEGSLETPVVGAGFRAKALRTGETDYGTFMGATYTITTGTNNLDYTVTIDMPYPPADPANAWQCACNATPGDQ